MRLGLVVECSTGGPDATIYKYVAETLCPGMQIDKPVTCIKKPKLIEEAGLHALALLASGCNRVLIIWDRIPAWGGDGRCETDKEEITLSLNSAGVNMAYVALFCIDEELESWLYADGRWVQAYYQNKTVHPLNAFGNNDTPAKQRSPKNRLKSWLRDNKMREPDEFNDHVKIVKLMTDFSKAAAWNNSFGQYVSTIQQLCPPPSPQKK